MSCFNFFSVPEVAPLKGEATIVIAPIECINAVQLPASEQLRAGEITHPPSRIRYLAGRYLLREILSRWLVINPQNIPILLSSRGKPFLPGQEYQFSITHADQFVAAVFTSSSDIDPMPVGIDLEKERGIDILALARRFFSPEEVAFLENSPSHADFFKLWCCREAAIKADGRGLGELLAVTRIMPSDDDGDYTQVMVDGDSYSVHHWISKGDLHGAVAFLKPPSVIHWCELIEPIG